jgi:hypothetical protein
LCDTATLATLLIMSHTVSGPWMDRPPRILCLTAYLKRSAPYQLLVQEHDLSVAAALRPQYVIETPLWTPPEGPVTNRDLVLSIAAALQELVDPATADGHKLSRG